MCPNNDYDQANRTILIPTYNHEHNIPYIYSNLPNTLPPNLPINHITITLYIQYHPYVHIPLHHASILNIVILCNSHHLDRLVFLVLLIYHLLVLLCSNHRFLGIVHLILHVCFLSIHLCRYLLFHFSLLFLTSISFCFLYFILFVLLILLVLFILLVKLVLKLIIF